jgi:PTH1 family peptidyl-tRNA hydrolase
MKLVVGLGNPGRKYQGTRHNVGFDVLTELARRHAAGKPRAAYDGEVVDAQIEGERALLLCPHTFMNLSGQSVVKARDFYKLTNEELLIVCDDFNLPLAKLRLRSKGSSGGQKGLASVIGQFGTDEFSRLRIGVGEVPSGWDAADFVLSKFSKQDLKEIEPAIWSAADAVAVWVRHGIQEAMNRYN